jgi:hypothetical protein
MNESISPLAVVSITALIFLAMCCLSFLTEPKAQKNQKSKKAQKA